MKNNNANIYKYIKLFKHLESDQLYTYIKNYEIEKVNSIQEHNNCYSTKYFKCGPPFFLIIVVKIILFISLIFRLKRETLEIVYLVYKLII